MVRYDTTRATKVSYSSNLISPIILGIECFVCNATRVQNGPAQRAAPACLNPAKDDLDTTPCGVQSKQKGSWRCSKKHWAFSYVKAGVAYKEDRLVRGCSIAFPSSKGSCEVPDEMERQKVVEELLANDTEYSGYKSLKVHKVSECQCNSNMCNNWPYYESNNRSIAFQRPMLLSHLIMLTVMLLYR